MYLDIKRLSLAAVAIIASIVVWWFVEQTNQHQREAIEKMERLGEPEIQVSEDPIGDLKMAIENARLEFNKGAYDKAIASIQEAWPPFIRVYYNEKDLVVDGLPVQEWFAQKRPAIEPFFAKPYEQLVDQLVQGDVSLREVDNFIKDLPHIFSRSLQKRFQAERDEILEKRAALIPQWVFLSIGASMAYSQEYEDALSPIVMDRIPEDFKYKVVTTGTMDRREDYLAARSIGFYMEGGNISYTDDPDQLGGHQVIHSVKLEYLDKTKKEPAVQLSWDKLEPILVENELPEKVVFELEHERQGVSFDSIREKQRKQLIELLRAELEQKLPSLSIVSP